MSDLETLWEQPRFVSYVSRLGARARVLLVEKRGTGMSDRPTRLPTLDERSDDIRAVLDAVGSERAVLHASYEGCRLAILFAATHPQRVEGLVLVDPSARGSRSTDYPWAPSDGEWERMIEEVEARWGEREYHEQADSRGQSKVFARPRRAPVVRATDASQRVAGRRGTVLPDDSRRRRHGGAPRRSRPDARAPPAAPCRRGALRRRADRRRAHPRASRRGRRVLARRRVGGRVGPGNAGLRRQPRHARRGSACARRPAGGS